MKTPIILATVFVVATLGPPTIKVEFQVAGLLQSHSGGVCFKVVREMGGAVAMWRDQLVEL